MNEVKMLKPILPSVYVRVLELIEEDKKVLEIVK